MDLVDILGVVNYGLVFFFGSSLGVSIAGGCRSRREWALLFALCPIFLAFQTLSWLTLGLATTKQLYPLLIHLPLLLLLVFGLKRPVWESLVSICTAYLCCQLPRCGDIVTVAITGSPLAGQIAYAIVIAPIFVFLLRYFVPSARAAITESTKSLLLFGLLPIIYYIFDYTTAIYTDLLYSGSTVVAELLPTVVGLFYMIFTTAYRRQLQQKTEAELQSSLMAGQLKQAETDLASLRQAEAQAATYQHDMRHHLAAINAFLSSGKIQQAEEYIKEVQADIEVITPRRFCENELVNLLCSSFSAKARRMDVRLSTEVALPACVYISDTELCALLSNGLENALNAVQTLSENCRWVEFYCGIQAGKLLIEIKNPFSGPLSFRDGLPESRQPNHGHGCRSISTIVQSHHGLCEFHGEDGIFTLRVVLPV